MTLVLLFQGVPSTPVVGNETFTLSEASSVSVTLATTEGFALSEVSASSLALAANDLTTLSDASLLSSLFSVNDSAAFSDVSSLLSVVSISASDSGAVVDVSALSALLSRVDSWSLDDTLPKTITLSGPADAVAFSELASVLSQQLLNAVDSWTVTDVSALNANADRSESVAFSDQSSIAADMSRVDAWSLGETSGVLSVDLKTASDSWAVSEVSGLLTTNNLSANDSSTVTDTVAGISATVTANDIQNLLEVSAIDAAMLRTDAWSLSEVAAVAPTVFQTVNESATLAELAGLSAQVAANDSGALSEAISQIADTTNKIASDSFTFSDASSLGFIIAISASDSLTLNVETAGVVTFFEAPYIHHKQPLSGTITAAVTDGTVLALVHSDGTVVAHVTTGTVADAVTSAAQV